MADKALTVDGNPSIRELSEEVIHSNDLETTVVGSGQAALHLLKDHAYGVIFMDVMLGDMEGFEVTRAPRSQGIKTLAMIVSECNEDYDSPRGPSIGADDYITEPPRPLVLGTKIKTLIRRNRNLSSNSLGQLERGPFSYSTSTMCFYKDGGEISLSSRGSSLMFLFIRHPGQIFTKEMIYERVWDNTVAVGDNVTMVYISRLRSEIEEDRQKPAYIMTVRGLGCQFIP